VGPRRKARNIVRKPSGASDGLRPWQVVRD
jgi:hypothetical protein